MDQSWIPELFVAGLYNIRHPVLKGVVSLEPAISTGQALGIHTLSTPPSAL